MLNPQERTALLHPSLHLKIFDIAWPIMVTSLTLPLLGLVDVALLSHFANSTHTAVVSIGHQFFMCLFWAFGFLKMGSTGYFSQALGRGQSIEALLAQLLIIAVSLGLLLIALGPAINHAMLWLMSPTQLATPWLVRFASIQYFSSPLVLASFVFMGALIALQRTRSVMWMMLGANAVNIVLDYVLIRFTDLQSVAVAWGTLGADCFMCLYGAVACRQSGVSLVWPKQSIKVFIALLKPMLFDNLELFVRTLLLLCVLLSMTALGSRLGEFTLTLNHVLFQVILFAVFLLDGIANAAESLIGRAIGAKQPMHAKVSMIATFFWVLVFSLLIVMLLWHSSNWWLPLVMQQQSMIEAFARYQWYLVAILLSGGMAFWVDGVFIASLRFKAMRQVMLIAVAFVYFPLTWLLKELENHGVWLAMSAFFVVRAILMFCWMPALLQQVFASMQQKPEGNG